jgi:AraC-like DNA-binding protein
MSWNDQVNCHSLLERRVDLVFDPKEHTQPDRYKRFQDVVAEHTGGHEIVPHDRASLNASIRGLIREPFTFNAFTAHYEPISVTRPQRLILPEETCDYWITAVTDGEWAVRSNNGHFVMKPGEVIIFDPADEIAVNFRPGGPNADSTIINVTMPKHLLTAASGALPARFPIYISLANPMSTILYGMISNICHRASEVNDGHIERVMDRLADIICETILENFKYRDQYQTYEATHAWLAKATIERNLLDREINLPTIAALIGKSAAYVRRLFAHENTTFEDWVWSRRLERLREEFERPDRLNASVTAIAANWGYDDVSNMSEDLITKFGLDAADFRNTARIRASKSAGFRE